MVYFYILFVVFTQNLFAQLLEDNSSDSIVMSVETAKLQFKQLRLSDIELTDLSYNPLEAPSYKELIVNLWQIDCTGCTEKMRANWKNKNEIWINLDRNSSDVARARNFLKHEKINIVSYLDVSQGVRKQMGKFLLPKKLLVRNKQVIEVIN